MLLVYHYTAALVVEDGRLQLQVLPSDDGVGEAELQEEGLEDDQLFGRGQAKTLLWQAEGLSLPGGDGVRDGDGHLLHTWLSAEREKEREHSLPA